MSGIDKTTLNCQITASIVPLKFMYYWLSHADKERYSYLSATSIIINDAHLQIKSQLISHIREDLVVSSTVSPLDYHLLLSTSFHLLHCTPPFILVEHFYLDQCFQHTNTNHWISKIMNLKPNKKNKGRKKKDK